MSNDFQDKIFKKLILKIMKMKPPVAQFKKKIKELCF